MWFERWRPYVPVAQRVANGRKYAANLAKKEKRTLAPVNIVGRNIANTFWGKAWCENLEAYSDFSNRLPRGRSYARNGSVIDLQIERGKIKALVSGSSVYTVTIDIATLPKAIWEQVKNDSAQSIDSMLDLLAGRFDDGVMSRLTRREDGLFPKPNEIELNCSCPDWATMCKHCAAVLYGIGARLDSAPEVLFLLRGVEHTELIGQAVSAENLDKSLTGKTKSAIPTGDLGEMFGIDLVGALTGESIAKSGTKRTPKPARSKAKKATVKVAAARAKPKVAAGLKKAPKARPRG